MSEAITDPQLMLEEKRLCGDGSYTTRAEELREGYKQVHGEDEEFAHGANGSTTTGAFKTARQRRSPSNYEFAIHRQCPSIICSPLHCYRIQKLSNRIARP